MTDVVDRLAGLEQAVVAATDRRGAAEDGPRIAGLARADAVAVLGPDDPGDVVSGRFAATALAHLALAGCLDHQDARTLLARLGAAERPRAELAAVGHPVLAALPLPVALGVHADLLAALAELTAFSAWRTDLAGQVIAVHDDGSAPAGSSSLAAATRCLVERGPVSTGAITATPVEAFGGVAAALVWRTASEDTHHARRLVAQSAAALVAPLQLALTADENLDAHRALVQAPERRLTRLALDLHDGALQDVALVAGELRRLEDELRPALRGRPEGEPVRATLETLASLVAALDADLREVATTFEGPSMLRRPFSDAIESVAASFRSRARIPVSLELAGDLGTITHAQRITLFRVVQESLANVRQHAEAQSVAIAVTGRATLLEAEVSDDGVGFDPRSVGEDAARSGRLGLVGMVERVRLLGGRIDIDSVPGRGTTVRVALVRYEPLADRRSTIPRA